MFFNPHVASASAACSVERNDVGHELVRVNALLMSMSKTEHGIVVFGFRARCHFKEADGKYKNKSGYQ